jgi:hypothetical protein
MSPICLARLDHVVGDYSYPFVAMIVAFREELLEFSFATIYTNSASDLTYQLVPMGVDFSRMAS